MVMRMMTFYNLVYCEIIYLTDCILYFIVHQLNALEIYTITYIQNNLDLY